MKTRLARKTMAQGPFGWPSTGPSGSGMGVVVLRPGVLVVREFWTSSAPSVCLMLLRLVLVGFREGFCFFCEVFDRKSTKSSAMRSEGGRRVSDQLAFAEDLRGGYVKLADSALLKS